MSTVLVFSQLMISFFTPPNWTEIVGWGNAGGVGECGAAQRVHAMIVGQQGGGRVFRVLRIHRVGRFHRVGGLCMYIHTVPPQSSLQRRLYQRKKKSRCYGCRFMGCWGCVLPPLGFWQACSENMDLLPFGPCRGIREAHMAQTLPRTVGQSLLARASLVAVTCLPQTSRCLFASTAYRFGLFQSLIIAVPPASLGTLIRLSRRVVCNRTPHTVR